MGRVVQVALLALVGCGGDDPGARVLSESEAVELFKAMGPLVRLGERIYRTEHNGEFVACADGGDMRTVTDYGHAWEGDTLVAYFRVIAAPRGCVLGGLVVDGSPSVAYAQVGRGFSPLISSGTAMGEVGWSLSEPDGTAHDGTCSIEMNLDAVLHLDSSESTGTFMGKLCDHHVELDVREYGNIWMLPNS